MSRKIDYTKAIEYLRQKKQTTAKELAVDVFDINPQIASAWGCQYLSTLAGRGVVRKITQGKPGRGGAAIWVYIPQESVKQNPDLPRHAIPLNGKQCYFNGERIVHFYECGCRTCNCGEKTVPDHRSKYTEYPRHKKTWRQKIAET